MYVAQGLYSVEQVADRLGLHVRTVRGYVREGRLKAVRVGKQYRIAAEDLEAMTGLPAESFEPKSVGRTRFVEVSSVVEIDAVSPELASRVTNGLLGAVNHRASDQPTRVESIYNEVRAHLKVIITGSVTTVGGLLQLLNLYLES
jgi:excisionase family DNA binding protein